MRLSFLSISILIFFLLNHCAGFITQTWKPPKTRKDVNEVRVLLGKESKKQIRFKSSGLLEVYDVNDLLIKKSIDLVQINPEALKAEIKIKPQNGEISFGDIKYRGRILLTPINGEIIIVNLVNLEDYLYSVVPSEVPSSWPEEALKAQAVCARTYVIREMLNKANEPFDVSKTTASQVYSGLDKETPRTTKAVDDTKGTIIVHEGMPIQAFFHSNAGGYTERPENVWSAKLPYLDHVDSKYDQDAPNYSWEDRIASVQMNRLLASVGVGYITDIRVIKRNLSQRVEILEIKGEKGTLNIRGSDFRKMVGETKLKSLKFGIKKESNSFYIKGLGFGHGVGMSQWGAFGMAKNNYNYASILSHYYPKTDLAKIVY
ncbi:MAG: SpoIID/LytB domain-containing protein [Leptospira sp.]|nr:SpoIID/LytB domain-containing protein [Leptospira sp.]